MPNIPPEKEAAKPSPDVKYEVIFEDESPELQAEYVITWPREDMLSVDAVCEKTPPCTDLIANPKGVFENKECWPDHLCYEELMCQSKQPPTRKSRASTFPAFAGHSEWAMLGSNQRPLPCESSVIVCWRILRLAKSLQMMNFLR